MNEQEIIGGNKLIAQFHGIAYNHVQNYYLIKSLSFIGKDTQMKYHSSWDWLMPVVEKIEQSGYVTQIWGLWNKKYTYSFSVTIKGNLNIIAGRGISDNSKIEAVYTGVVEFIKWYTQQNELSVIKKII